MKRRFAEMTAHEKITCDGCNADLSNKSSTPLRYRLTLSADYILTNNYSSYDPPPFEGSLHFCGIKCLDQWSTAGGPPAAKPAAQRED